MEHAMLNFIELFEADVKSFRIVGILRNLFTESHVKCVCCLENNVVGFLKEPLRSFSCVSYIFYISSGIIKLIYYFSPMSEKYFKCICIYYTHSIIYSFNNFGNI